MADLDSTEMQAESPTTAPQLSEEDQLKRDAHRLITDAKNNPVGFVRTLRQLESDNQALNQLQQENSRMQAQILALQRNQSDSAPQQGATTPSSTQPSASAEPLSSASATPALDPNLIATIVAAVAAALPRVPEARPDKTEKLSDIFFYDGEEDKLDDWDTALVSKMSGNEDRYRTDRSKIVYAESRLTVGKRAHTLMNRYRTKGLCTLTSFDDYRAKLRQACGNKFEVEDARDYLRNILKQEKLTFQEYYTLFALKAEKSGLEDVSLTEAMKKNITQGLRISSINYRKVDGTKPTSYDDHVKMYSDIDSEWQHIKHTHPSKTQATNNASTSSVSHKTTTAIKPSNTNSNASQSAYTHASSARQTPKPPALTITPVTPVAVASNLPPGDPMDLDAALTATRGQSLQVPGIREICDKFHLCYYCKERHSGFTAINCPNKKKKSSATNIRSLVVYDEAEAKINSENA